MVWKSAATIGSVEASSTRLSFLSLASARRSANQQVRHGLGVVRACCFTRPPAVPKYLDGKVA